MNGGTTVQPITRLQRSEWQESWTVLKQRGGRNVPIIYPAMHANKTSRIIITWRARSRQYVWQIVSLHGVHDHVSMCDKSYHHYMACTITSVCVTNRIIITSRARSRQYVWQIVSSLRHVHDRVSMCDKSFHRYMACTIMSVCVTNRHHYITCISVCNKSYNHYTTCMIM